MLIKGFIKTIKTSSDNDFIVVLFYQAQPESTSLRSGCCSCNQLSSEERRRLNQPQQWLLINFLSSAECNYGAPWKDEICFLPRAVAKWAWRREDERHLQQVTQTLCKVPIKTFRLLLREAHHRSHHSCGHGEMNEKKNDTQANTRHSVPQHFN